MGGRGLGGRRQSRWEVGWVRRKGGWEAERAGGRAGGRISWNKNW